MRIMTDNLGSTVYNYFHQQHRVAAQMSSALATDPGRQLRINVSNGKNRIPRSSIRCVQGKSPPPIQTVGRPAGLGAVASAPAGGGDYTIKAGGCEPRRDL